MEREGQNLSKVQRSVSKGRELVLCFHTLLGSRVDNNQQLEGAFLKTTEPESLAVC